MPDWLIEHAWVVWVGIATTLAVLELLSLDLVLLMFALGALAAAAAAGVSDSLVISMAVFVVVSPALLWFLRPPIVARLHSGPTLTTGHDALVGRHAVVLEGVTQFGGRIRLADDDWTARTESGAEIAPGAQVIVTRIEGATAIVHGQPAEPTTD